MKVKSYEMDMCNGSVLKKMLLFSIPLMCSSFLQLLFNAADLVIVGRFAGDHSLAAVGANTALINLMVNLFMGLSVGVNVMVAQYFGAKKDKEISETVHTAMIIAMISGIMLSVIGIIGAKKILVWMSTPEEIIGLAKTYLKIYFLGMPAMMIYNFGSAVLRASGDTKRPLYFLAVSGAVNVGLNMIFVICFDMDVAGVALATVISQCIAAGLVLWCMMKIEGSICLHWNQLKIHKDKFVQILKIGLPAGFQGILFSLSNVVIQSSVNSFGAIVVSGNAAASNIEGFVYVAMNTFHQSTMSFTSQNFGAGNYKRIHKIVLTGMACGIAAGVGFGSLAYIFREPLLQIYTSDPAAIAAGAVRFQYIMKIYFLCGMMDVMVGALRGIGYSMMPTIVSLVGVCGIRLLWIGTVFQKYHVIDMVYITYPISWLVTLIVLVTGYLKVTARWKKG